ncbi:MAG: hypothetical protein ABIJ81_03150 [Patescibacteria group bacterium]
MKITSKKAWVVSVEMGYGHERAAYGLKDLAYGEIVVANKYPGIPKKDKILWQRSRRLYETISRFKAIPLVGEVIFEVMDKLQSIPQFYPRRDLSRPNLQLQQVYAMISKGTGQHLIEQLIAKNKKLPLIATFFQVAFAAEEFGYPGEIYCVICDADCSRAWAPLDPKKSRIKYFAPNGRVVERLKLYGVRPENIYLTGFPLPKELIGGTRITTIKQDLARRLRNLDPNKIFLTKYEKTIASYLGRGWRQLDHKHLLTLTFAVGGAGAQKMIGTEIVKSLRQQIAQGKIRLNLVAGVRRDVAQFFLQGCRSCGLKKYINQGVKVLFDPNHDRYFAAFSKILHTTDILWTKPSELSFYTGLGLPIIMAPPVGSQEQFNRLWLKTVGSGISQNNPKYTNEWLFDWLNSGGLARVAWNGFIEAPTHGTYRIESIITGQPIEVEKLPLIV